MIFFNKLLDRKSNTFDKFEGIALFCLMVLDVVRWSIKHVGWSLKAFSHPPARIGLMTPTMLGLQT